IASLPSRKPPQIEGECDIPRSSGIGKAGRPSLGGRRDHRHVASIHAPVTSTPKITRDGAAIPKPPNCSPILRLSTRYRRGQRPGKGEEHPFVSFNRAGGCTLLGSGSAMPEPTFFMNAHGGLAPPHRRGAEAPGRPARQR